jgi:MotA/TolQ/ExbB proton channel family
MITNSRSTRFTGIAAMDTVPLARSEGGIMDWSRAIAHDGPTSDGPLPEQAPLWRWLVDLAGALGRDDPIAHRYLLLLRFMLANAVALALVGAAMAQGWVGMVLAADEGGMCLMIAAVFLVGLVWSAQRAVQLSQALNDVERLQVSPAAVMPAHLRLGDGRDGQSRALLASSLRLRLASRIAPIRHLANSLVLLGLIGTVVGFIMALSGVRPEVAADVNAIGPMVSTLIGGMSVALYTTLVGSILNVWLMVNVRLLEGGSVKLLTATIESGERRARS